MSDEEKEAVEWLENDVKKAKELSEKWHMYMVNNKMEVLSNLIKKQDRVIDSMANALDIAQDRYEEMGIERIKEYFFKKQEEN